MTIRDRINQMRARASKIRAENMAKREARDQERMARQVKETKRIKTETSYIRAKNQLETEKRKSKKLREIPGPMDGNLFKSSLGSSDLPDFSGLPGVPKKKRR